jgi:hypothetical protein
VKDAKIVAYAAQYVDDSTANDSEVHKDGGMLQTTATAHTNSEAIMNAAANHTEQRKVWVPFHFLPGKGGETLSEKLVCVKDSPVAQEIVKNHIEHAVSVKNEYGLSLMGIMAHVYADTFSHHGFSGVSSRNNAVKGGSFEFDVKNEQMLAYINNKFTRFLNKYTPSFLIDNWRKIANQAGELSVGALGHGGVGTYPDRPFLKWRFTYEKNDKDSGWRNNPEAYLEGCEKLHKAFGEYAQKANISKGYISFDRIKSKVFEILCLEADKKGRIDAWRSAIRQKELFESEEGEALEYSPKDWEEQKDNFVTLDNSHDIVKHEIYQFHQAAIYHRNYTLKELLPRYGIVVL